MDAEVLQKPNEKVLTKVSLFENVQFIYELALAKLELEAFGIKCNLKNNLREFLLENVIDFELLTKRLAYFKHIVDYVSDYYKLTRVN